MKKYIALLILAGSTAHAGLFMPPGIQVIGSPTNGTIMAYQDGALVAYDGSVVGASNAVDIAITDAGGYFDATDVEAALQEIGANSISDTISSNLTFTLKATTDSADYDIATELGTASYTNFTVIVELYAGQSGKITWPNHPNNRISGSVVSMGAYTVTNSVTTADNIYLNGTTTSGTNLVSGGSAGDALYFSAVDTTDWSAVASTNEWSSL